MHNDVLNKHALQCLWWHDPVLVFITSGMLHIINESKWSYLMNSSMMINDQMMNNGHFDDGDVAVLASIVVCWGKGEHRGILNIITKSRVSFLILVTVPKMPNLSLIPLKSSCHPQHDTRGAVLKYAIALLNK